MTDAITEYLNALKSAIAATNAQPQQRKLHHSFGSSKKPAAPPPVVPNTTMVFDLESFPTMPQPSSQTDEISSHLGFTFLPKAKVHTNITTWSSPGFNELRNFTLKSKIAFSKDVKTRINFPGRISLSTIDIIPGNHNNMTIQIKGYDSSNQIVSQDVTVSASSPVSSALTGFANLSSITLEEIPNPSKVEHPDLPVRVEPYASIFGFTNLIYV